MGKAKELADAKYPIVPLSLPETTPSGEILDSDKALDDFRISIQSFCSNHAFIEGYEQAKQDIMEKAKQWFTDNLPSVNAQLLWCEFELFITEN